MTKRKRSQQGSVKTNLVIGGALVLLVGGLIWAGTRPGQEYVAPEPSSKIAGCSKDKVKVDEIIRFTNDERSGQGIQPLNKVDALNKAAELKAQDMIKKKYWAHVSPDGVQPWHWFSAADYTYVYAGENLGKDYDTSSGMVQGWMKSESHRRNILNSNYTQTGVAVVCGEVEQGKGQTTLVVAMYGSARQ